MTKQYRGKPAQEYRRKQEALPTGRPGESVKWKDIRTRRPAPGRLYLSLVLVVLLFVAASPAAAHSMAGGVDHPNGIDDLWPIHAALMVGGVGSFFAAAGIVRFGRKTRWWYKVHPPVALAGAALSIGAIAVAVLMVANSEKPHLQFFHGWLGTATIIVILATPSIMLLRMKIAQLGGSPLKIHRSAGYTAISLMAVNVLLGLSMMHVI